MQTDNYEHNVQYEEHYDAPVLQNYGTNITMIFRGTFETLRGISKLLTLL